MTIFTDGGVRGNGREDCFGAAAFCTVEEGAIGYTHSEILLNTTNNRAELTAAISALNYASFSNPNETIYLFTDSEYLCKGFNTWMEGWRQKNWKGGKLPNTDLWKELYKLKRLLNVEMKWVRGHNGNRFNEYIDLVCQMAISGFIEDSKH